MSRNSGISSTISLIQNPVFAGSDEASYSYGDSAGFSPDFPFNPDKSGTKPKQM
jgi:hypothetical protein